ncbi:MAG: GldG family protein, partial [Thermodesulfobacteriota bacterium]|nr:GldG family protein [Thermodesulfobacteriota bacterium]
MRPIPKTGKYIKFLLYLVVIVLINIAGLTLFFRADLTSNRLYSLSDASKKVVSTLAEPLTIKVFFTKDLPAPHNNTERYLHDLLEEYALSSNRYFNYRFYNVNPDEGSLDDQTLRNQELAQTYGINPVQIQRVEADEVGFQRAYMGLVLIHGDMVERIDAVTTTDGLEYKLTTAIQKLNNKISAMLNLKDKIGVKLYFSSSLDIIAPLMQLQDLDKVPETIESIVTRLNRKNHEKLIYQRFDPDKDPSLYEEVEKHHLLALKWPAVPKHQIDAGKGAVGLVITYGEKSVSVPILQVLNIPLIGTHYEMVDLNNLEKIIDNALEKVVNINEELGYLADHGTLGGPDPTPMMPQGQSNITAFRGLASQTYTVRDINLEKEPIPDSLNALVIARPTKAFSDYELYQIDQFIMHGNNLILFPDRFQEVMPGGQQQMMMGGQTIFVPIDTGLEKLLSHWGVNVEKSYVLDENCFKQHVSQQMG